MTTALERPQQNGWAGYTKEPAPSTPPETPDTRPPVGGWFDRHPGWPIVAQLGWWPIWWASGIGDYSPILIALPMLYYMYKWRATGNRKIRFPPGFGIYLLFLVVMLAGAATLSLTAPDTEAGPASTRFFSWGLRAASYIAYAVLLLYAGNLTEKEFPRRRLAWQLGLVGLYAIGFGLFALVDPKLSLTSPFAHIVPQSLQNGDNGQIFAMLHPSITQIEVFSGYGRVTAPFLYANTWGNNVAILLPWLWVAWRNFGNSWQRKAIIPIMCISVVPILFSFDRGLWLAIGVAVVYLAVRFALQGNFALLRVVIAGLFVGVVVYFATPVHSLVSQRLSQETSDSARISLSILSTKDAVASPVIGYGDTRRELGGTKSIAVGRTSKCSSCGERSAGSNGQLWLLLITSGFVGTFLYLWFFGYGIWRYWRDETPYGLTGVLILLLSFVFMLIYDAVGATLAFTVFAYAILWRNDHDARLEAATSDAAQSPPQSQAPAGRRAIMPGASP